VGDLDSVAPMNLFTPDFEAEARQSINPIFVDVIGAESWARKIMLDEIDRLRLELEHEKEVF
jgi:hypothetical protein